MWLCVWAFVGVECVCWCICVVSSRVPAWMDLPIMYLPCLFSVNFRLLCRHGFIMFSWNFAQHHLAAAQEVPLHENHWSPDKLLWPLQANKSMNNIFHPFIFSLIKRSDVLGRWRVLVSCRATGSFAVRTTDNQPISAFPGFQTHPSYFYWFAESKSHVLRSSHRCHGEILMPSIWELHYLKYFLSPGSFSVKQTPQLTAIVGALSVYSRTEAVGEKDENLLQNVKMAADLEASGSVLHPFQCPRKYNFTSNKFSPLGFFPLVPQLVSWKIWGQKAL